ncbi:MAG: carboxypeptidase regulatory-like domain-containing protein [Thermoguttaceae bacterium]|nr:carboxypeptidase regulatory-like domain-containing protein [Thermoguttaceae bacterium]MBR5757643.1 carboxypeptidase regulatory-like domain-containing protein [Thermoguttaceae bacterium]
MKRALIISLLVLPLTALCGCGEKTPPDMPKLFPTSITITQEGTPVEGASVQLLKKDDLYYKWLAGGTTDASGVCTIRTMGKYTGAPEGTFQVVVYKTNKIESETRKAQPNAPSDPAEAAEWAKKVDEEEKEFDQIDTKYKSVDTTDLTITIASGKNAETLEVGAPVNIEVKKARL